MNCYARNRILVSRRADLDSAALDAIQPPPGLVLETSAAGDPTARLDGKMVHSGRDPRAEAARLVAPYRDANLLALFYGFGLGYHVERFLHDCPEAVAVVIEPEPALLRAALESRDLSSVLDCERVHFMAGADADALAMLLRAHENRTVKTVLLRSIYERNQDYYRRLDTVQEQFAARRDINTNTVRRFAGVWIRNLARNVSQLAYSSGISVAQNRFAGLPAVVLAAGPSLDHVLPHIDRIRKRALLVAVDTAAAALAALDVAPDFLVVVDPQWWNTRHLDRLSLDHAILVSESSTHPRVFQLLRGCTLFAASLFPLGRFLERSTRIEGVLGAGGSVATSAWDLARVLGCDPVYCAGLDLGFPHRRTHCRGSFFEERAHTLARRTVPAEHQAFSYLFQADPYLVDDNSGGEVLTDRRMAIYHWWFANQAKIHSTPATRNLSAEGARIEGFGYAPLEELLGMPEQRRQIDARLLAVRRAAQATQPDDAADSARGSGGTDAESALYGRLRLLIAELKRTAELCREGLQTIKRARTGAIGAVTALDGLQRIDGELRLSTHRDIAGFMVQDVLAAVTRGGANPTEEAGRESGDPLAGSENVYRALRRSAVFHVAELERALKFLSAAPKI